jgi:hypothetical protein
MGSIKVWLAKTPAVQTNGRPPVVARAVSCYLLERGAVVVNPRCAACGTEFRHPRYGGERFRVALEVFEPPLPDRARRSTLRLFVGRNILIARAASSLQPLVNRSIAYVGPRVMAAVLAGKGSSRIAALFCARCAQTIAAHLNPTAERYYAWDWLADFEPRRILPRLYRRVRPKPRELPLFTGLPAPERRRALAAQR